MGPIYPSRIPDVTGQLMRAQQVPPLTECDQLGSQKIIIEIKLLGHFV